MKEYTEIKITHSRHNHPEMLEPGDMLTFKFEETSLRMLVGGKLINIENDLLTFETQGFAERIPKSEGNSGTKVEIFKDWKKTEKICDGIIQRKYFVKAKKGDWKITHELNEKNSIETDFEMTFTQKEKELLELGETPIQMEDKWFIFQEDNKVRFFRSWTGIEIYQGELEKKGDQTWGFSTLRMNPDNPDMGKTEKVSMLESYLRSFLKSRTRIIHN